MAVILRSSAMLFIVALLGSTFAHPDNSLREKPDIFLQERAICYEDDTLLSFRYWRIDSEPYCSKLLDIEDITSTLPPATSRTTTTTVSSSVRTLPTTTTVTRVSEFTTITTTVAKNQKRENAATITSTIDVQPQPYAYNYVQSMVSGANINASLASSVYSACSCLQITPKTVSAQSTIETTRTIKGSVGETQAAATVTIGTSTVTITEIVHSDSSSMGGSSITRGPSSASSVPSIRTPSFSTSAIALNDSYSTGTGSGPRGGDSTSSASYATINTTLPTSIPSSIPSSTTSSQLPVGTSINQIGCPGINNTIFTTVAGQQYQLQCYRVYGGAALIGLDRSNARECIEQCSTVNAGFSAIGCYGVTWLQYDQGIHCNLKSQSALRDYTTSSLAVSAVLLTGVPPPVVGLFGGSRVGVVEAQQEEEKGVVGGEKDLPFDHPSTWRMAKVPRRLGVSWRW